MLTPCTLMPGVQIDDQPLTTGVNQLNSAVLVTTHVYSYVRALGVKMEVTRNCNQPKHLFIKISILNQVYLGHELFGVKYTH